MKFISGGNQEVAQESITSRMLIDAGVANADFVPTIMRLYKDNFMLNYLLDLKKLKTKGLSQGTNTNSYRTVSSNHIKYRIAETDTRIEHFRANDEGLTFVDELGSLTNPGQHGSIITIFSDTRWLGYKEVAQLGDNETQMWAINDPEETPDGLFATQVKLVTSVGSDYILPELLADGAEFEVIYNAHEQDFSTRGVEKYEFKKWGDTYLTLSRFKYSWSGTAGAMMKNKKAGVMGKFVEHGGQTLFLSKAENEMMKRISVQMNNAHLFGKGTVDVDGNTVLKDIEGRPVIIGDGIYHSNEGPIRLPYNGWTREFLNYFVTEIDQWAQAGEDGNTEVYLGMASMAYASFQELMGKMDVSKESQVVGEGSAKGINATYAYYEFAGIKLIPHKEPSMKRRARQISADGTYLNDWDCIAVPLGETSDGKNGIELVQLRDMTSGTVAGIDEGGKIASSVDGTSKHVLLQNGIINQNQIFILRKLNIVRR